MAMGGTYVATDRAGKFRFGHLIWEKETEAYKQDGGMTQKKQLGLAE